MADFKTAYLIGRDNEGGYVNDSNDKGGETYAGVARNYWPKWDGWKIIDVIKKHRTIKHGEKINNAELEGNVFNFYKDNFWDKILGDVINDQQVANIFYDWTLTSGKAIEKVQGTIGAIPDGKFGPNSILAINNMIENIGGENTFNTIKHARAAYYQLIAVGTNAKFLKGWMNRVNNFNYKAQ